MQQRKTVLIAAQTTKMYLLNGFESDISSPWSDSDQNRGYLATLFDYCVSYVATGDLKLATGNGCRRLKQRNTTNLTPWTQVILQATPIMTAAIGPSGGNRGYLGITGTRALMAI